MQAVDHYMDLTTQQGESARTLFTNTKGRHTLIQPGAISQAYEPMLEPVWGRGEVGADGEEIRFNVDDLPAEIKAEYPMDELFPGKFVTLYDYRHKTAVHRQRRNPIFQRVLWNVTTPPESERSSGGELEQVPTLSRATPKGAKGLRRSDG